MVCPIGDNRALTSFQNAASALREADKWAALATSLEDILESGVPTQGDKLGELAEQVAAMTASLEVGKFLTIFNIIFSIVRFKNRFQPRFFDVG